VKRWEERHDPLDRQLSFRRLKRGKASGENADPAGFRAGSHGVLTTRGGGSEGKKADFQIPLPSGRLRSAEKVSG